MAQSLEQRFSKESRTMGDFVVNSIFFVICIAISAYLLFSFSLPENGLWATLSIGAITVFVFFYITVAYRVISVLLVSLSTLSEDEKEEGSASTWEET